MAWQELQYRLTSSAPLVMHNGQTADPLNKWSKAIKQISSKRKKTDADYEEMARLEFMAGLYIDENGPVIPADVISAMVTSAAKKSREGVLAESGCICDAHATLEYDGPRDPKALWDDERFRFSKAVRVKNARIMRMRPIFQKWATTIRLKVENTVINPSVVDDWMATAGPLVGLCDWRPQYGRFIAERLNGKG